VTAPLKRQIKGGFNRGVTYFEISNVPGQSTFLLFVMYFRDT
jgi:hypothetical protein